MHVSGATSDLALTARTVNAQEACTIGLVTQVCLSAHAS